MNSGDYWTTTAYQAEKLSPKRKQHFGIPFEAAIVSPQVNSHTHLQSLHSIVNNKDGTQHKYYGQPMIVQQSNYMKVPHKFPSNPSGSYGNYGDHERMPYNTGINYYPPPTEPNNAYNTTQHTEEDKRYSTDFCCRLQEVLPSTPLVTAMVREDASSNQSQRRAKRKSKFSRKQDEMIVYMKKQGKSWVEIAEVTGVGSYLAARNRYQVIVGQQGNNNSSSWKLDDKKLLQNIVDGAELRKWEFIASELNKATNKNFTGRECRDVVRKLIWNNPSSYGLSEQTIKECFRERNVTIKCNAQNSNNKLEQQYAHDLFDFSNANEQRFTSNSNNPSYYGNDQDIDEYGSSSAEPDDEFGKGYM